ncbi:MAG: Rab family GTPase, partial [Candidatus Odinarchaeia archaeon]
MKSDKRYVFKVIVIGDGFVGKTSLILRFTHNMFNEEYKKTLGTDFAIKNFKVDDSSVKLQIWDLGGQEIFKDLRRVFYPGSKGALIVYDVTDRKSFENVRNWYNDIRSVAKNIPIILVANKIDLPREVSREEGINLAKSLKVSYIETSAKTNEYVEDAFKQIARLSISGNYVRPTSVDLDKPQESVSISHVTTVKELEIPEKLKRIPESFNTV